MEHIGIDLHKNSSQICICTEEGRLIERRIQTSRQSFAKALGGRPRARIVVESSTESEWVARCLEELGHEVIVADPNFAPMYAQRSKKIKTDRRDARALCEACRLGAYRPAHRTSDTSRALRRQVSVREALVHTRTRYISLIRSMLRAQGYRVRSGGSRSFCQRVIELELPQSLEAELEPLFLMLDTLNAQIKAADHMLEQHAKTHEVAKRLCTAAGVGPVTAVSFVATIDNVERFTHAKQLRAYLGLVPRELSSGEKQRRGHITKAGNRRMRSLLVEAAWQLMRSKRPDTEQLRDWASRIALRRGKRIAAVALARKLAGILFAMWRDGTDFGQPKGQAAQAA